MVKTRELWAVDLGMMGYKEALELQFRLLEAKKAGELEADVLLLLEHPPVITLGLRGDESNIVATPEVLAEREIEVHRIRRGGDVTYHGPGQLVAYPIINLRRIPKRKDVGRFVWAMQEAIIRTLKSYGIPSERIDKVIGVWVRRPARSLLLDVDGLPWNEAYRAEVDAMLRPFEDRKIAAIGARIKSWITFHGFALNVNTDLTDFKLIVPCGLQDRGVTSMQAELGRPLEMAPIKKEIAQHLVEQWGHELVWKEKEEVEHGSRGWTDWP
ncbi:MAG: lipoyl(octanoyl) transferase LipB [Ardenticatenaceae bacterium]